MAGISRKKGNFVFSCKVSVNLQVGPVSCHSYSSWWIPFCFTFHSSWKGNWFCLNWSHDSSQWGPWIDKWIQFIFFLDRRASTFTSNSHGSVNFAKTNNPLLLGDSSNVLLARTWPLPQEFFNLTQTSLLSCRTSKWSLKELENNFSCTHINFQQKWT